MRRSANKIAGSQQHTNDIEGYYYTANDGSQVAFWHCYSDQTSEKHCHEFDEFIVCLSGQYFACFLGEEHLLSAGDELLIPAGTLQWGRCLAGTRTIHFFGGKRVEQ